MAHGIILKGVNEARVPLIIGSAAGSGTNPKVEWTLDILREICEEQNIDPRVVVLRSEIDRDTLKSKIQSNKISPLGPIAPLTSDDADTSHRVVAMMGVEPFQEALEAGAQIVIAGRSSDAAIYASVPLRIGADPGLSWHMGKIIECGAQVIEPREGQDCLI